MSLFVNEFIVAMPGAIAVLVAMRVLVDLAVQVAVGLIEAILARPDFRPQTEVPLAEQAGDVAAVLQRPGKGGRFQRQTQGTAAVDGTGDAEAAGIAAGEQTGACRRAGRADVVSFQTHAGRGESVEVSVS